MNFTKVLPAIAAAVVLSACAKEAPVMEKASAQMSAQTASTITDKTVVYSCNKKNCDSSVSI